MGYSPSDGALTQSSVIITVRILIYRENYMLRVIKQSGTSVLAVGRSFISMPSPGREDFTLANHSIRADEPASSFHFTSTNDFGSFFGRVL
jgi:hypothetical protein